MRRYDAYKDSGIEWIGEIPSHWKKARLAYNGIFFKGKGVSKADLSIDGLPVILYGDIYTKYNLKTKEFERRISNEIARNSFSIEKGDLLFAASGETPEEIGKCICYVGEDEAFASGDVIVFRQNKNNSIFLSYLFNSYKLNEQKAKLSKGEIVVHIYSGQLRDIQFPLPTFPEEQAAIANFLDHKTEEIDELIANKKRLLELYEEEKTAIINQAVTKGLDTNVPMKKSGIEWLGKIPEHWEVKRLKYVASINDEVLTEKTDGEIEIKYVEISGVKSGIGVVETSDLKFKDAPSRARRIVRDGDVLVSTVRTYLKSIAKVDNPTDNLIASTGFAVVRPRKIDSDYTGFLFYSEPLIGEIISLSTGVSYPAINSSQIGDIKIPIPPMEEQKAIALYIEENMRVLKGYKNRTEKLIELLTEYRTALISEVVTGKIKVID